MKKVIISLLVLAASFTLFGFSAAARYDYEYFMAYGNNYFPRSTINASVAAEKEWFKFYTEFDATVYFGEAVYNIPYPDIDSTVLGMLPSYVSFSNSYIFPQMYISLFLSGINLKLGRFMYKLGISEIYSPADILTSQSPFNLYSKQEGINGISVSYSLGDYSLSAVYQDGSKYEDTKQGLKVEAMNRLFSFNGFAVHYFKTLRDIFSSTQRECFLGGFSLLTDALGPGMWAEFVWDWSSLSSQRYITLGADYTFYDALFIQAEYMRNFDGKDSPFTESTIVSRLLNKQFAVGKNYLFSTVRTDFAENFEAGLISAVNIDDRSFEAGATAAYNPFDFASLSVSAILSKGDIHDEFFWVPPTFLFKIEFSFL